MSNRLGLLEPTALEGKQKEDYDLMNNYTTVTYGKLFTTKLNNGSLVGPFGCQLHIPGIAEHFIGFAKTLASRPGLSPRAREVCINVVGAHTKAAYEHMAHDKLALQRGLSVEQIDQIDKGVCPEDLGADEKAAFDVATQLLEVPGPLRQDVWDHAVEVLGKDGAAVLVQYVGFYRYIATILNGFDAQVPQADLQKCC